MERSWTRRQRPRGPGGGHPARGISLVELLIVLAIIGMIGLFGVPAIAKMLRRMQGASMVSGVTRVLNTARLAAIKGVSGPTGTGLPAPVVVLIEKGGTGEQVRLRSFVDLDQDFAPTPDEATQAYLDDVLFPEEFSFWKHGGAEDSLTEGAPFNTYRIPGATADDATLVNRVVFLPTGGIAVPQADDSARPTKDAGRGIYFADRDGRNYFRVTIPADSVAKPVAEKWVDATTGYSPAGWVFK